MRKIRRSTAAAKGLFRYFDGRPSCNKGHISQRYVLNNNCVQCLQDASKKHKLENPDKIAAYRKLPRVKEWHLNYRRDLKAAALKAYGNRCKCCGEEESKFLTIDHIKGGGRQHRLAIGSATYRWLKNHKYPKGFRVLCWNCNCAIGLFGKCPHKEKHK